MDTGRHDKWQTLRAHLWTVMHDGKGTAGHVFNFVLILLILLAVALIPLEFLLDEEQYTPELHAMEAVIVACFTVEYLLRIFAAPKRLQYVFSFFGLVDLLSIAPFYAGIFGTEYIRLLRIIRLFKIGEMEAAADKEDIAVMQKGIGLMEGEHVDYVVTKGPVVLFLGLIPPIVAVSFGIGILLGFGGPVSLAVSISLFFFALIFLWKAWLDFSYDVIYVTNYRLVFQNQHILGRSINQVNFGAITNVKPFYPSALSYILRYGSLVIDTAAEHPGQISLHMVRKHEEAAHIIMQRCFGGHRAPATPRRDMQEGTAADQPVDRS